MDDKIEELEMIIRFLQLQREALTDRLDRVGKERDLFFKQKQDNIARLEVVRRKLQVLENPIRLHLKRSENAPVPNAPWRVYLSSRWDRQAELREYRERLIGYEFHVVSRWLDIHDELPAVWGENAARIDLEDIEISNIVICFSEAPGSPFSRGGRHVEFGYALADPNKLLAVVGEHENIFHSLVPHFESFDECLKYMVGGF